MTGENLVTLAECVKPITDNYVSDGDRIEALEEAVTDIASEVYKDG